MRVDGCSQWGEALRGPCIQKSAVEAVVMEAKVLKLQVGEDLGGLGAPAATPDEEITREQRRSRRKRDVRARTISVKRMTKRELEIGRLLYPETDYWKPRTRGECKGGPRPCPFISCKHHLYVDVSPRTGAIKLNFPDLEVWELTESCALDIADHGGTTLEDVGAIMNLTRERIRQVEVKALAKLEALSDMETMRDYVEEGPVGKRRLPKISQNELDPRTRSTAKLSLVSDTVTEEEESGDVFEPRSFACSGLEG